MMQYFNKGVQAKPKDKPEVVHGGKKHAADKPSVADDGNKLPAEDQAPAANDTGLRDASLATRPRLIVDELFLFNSINPK